MLIDLIRLFYPNCCISCNKTLVEGEDILCIECFYSIPKSDSFKQKDKLMLLLNNERVWNFIALFEFGKNQLIQELIHNLKYKKQKQIGIFFGRKMAEEFKRSNLSDKIDYVVSVPITRKRLFQRGYNQTDVISREFAKSLNKPFFTKLLKKVGEKESQINRSIFDRWKNVENRFEIFKLDEHSKILNGKHLVLVDDVVTTGATLEACARELLKIENCKISFAVVATA